MDRKVTPKALHFIHRTLKEEDEENKSRYGTEGCYADERPQLVNSRYILHYK